MLLWWIGVVCVRKVGSLLITSFFIVRLQKNYGVSFQLFSVARVMPRRVRWLLVSWKGQFLELAKVLALKCYYMFHMLLGFIYGV
jgi:hypothetical protein